MHYTNSPVFKLIPTHCTVCNRALIDGTSIEHGIGPICRKQYGYEDAYDLDDTSKIIAIVKGVKDSAVKDRVLEAVLENDSRKAVNTLNRALATWSRDIRENEKEMKLALEAMREMGYVILADTVAGRLAEVKITLEKGRLVLDTPYNPHFVAEVKTIPGRKWDGDSKVWSVPATKKREAWKALLNSYEGSLASGPKGLFRIEALSS